MTGSNLRADVGVRPPTDAPPTDAPPTDASERTTKATTKQPAGETSTVRRSPAQADWAASLAVAFVVLIATGEYIGDEVANLGFAELVY